MTRELRSTITLLSISAVAGILAAACSGGDDQGQTNSVSTGGARIVVLTTGGKPAATGGKSGAGGSAPTGGKSSTGGATTAAGGSIATGGAAPTGGSASVGGNTAATGGNSSVGGSSAVGGTTTVGGSSTTGGSTGTAGGGSSAVGGTTNVGGSSTAGSGAGGSSTAGGTTASGGSSTAGGVTAVGGSSAGGGSSAPANCPIDDSSNDSSYSGVTGFCRPASADLSLVTGQLSVSTLNINATGGQIVMTGSVPFTGNLTLAPPFNQAPCTSSGLDAEVANSNPAVPYTGLTLTVTNSRSTPTTLVLYLADRIKSGGSSYYVIATAPIEVGGNATTTKTLRWADLSLGLLDGTPCAVPGGAAFDPKQILAIGLGFIQTGAVNLTVTNVTFSTT